MRTAETALDMLRISKIAARNPVTHFMSLPSGSSKLIGSLCVMREAATVLIQVHGFVWARCAAHVQRNFPRSDAPRRSMVVSAMSAGGEMAGGDMEGGVDAKRRLRAASFLRKLAVMSAH